MTTPVRMLINQLLEFDHFGSRQAASLHADEISPDHPGRLPDKKQQVPQKMKLTKPSSGLRLSAKYVHDGYQIFVTLAEDGCATPDGCATWQPLHFQSSRRAH